MISLYYIDLNYRRNGEPFPFDYPDQEVIGAVIQPLFGRYIYVWFAWAYKTKHQRQESYQLTRKLG